MGQALQKVLIASLEQNKQFFTPEHIKLARSTNQYKYFSEIPTASNSSRKDSAASQQASLLSQRPKPNLDEILIRFEGDDKALEFGEKEEMFNRLHGFPDKFLEKVVELIQHLSPQTAITVSDTTRSVSDPSESMIMFDFDDFDPIVQRHVYRYVQRCQQQLDLAKEQLEQRRAAATKGTAKQQQTSVTAPANATNETNTNTNTNSSSSSSSSSLSSSSSSAQSSDSALNAQDIKPEETLAADPLQPSSSSSSSSSASSSADSLINPDTKNLEMKPEMDTLTKEA